MSLRTDRTPNSPSSPSRAESDAHIVKAVSKGSLDALDELKSTDQLISASLKHELEALRKQHKALQVDFDQQKSQLIDALVSKDKLRKDMDEAVREPPIQSPTTAEPGGAVLDKAVVDEIVQKSNEKIGKLRGRVKQQVDVSSAVSVSVSAARRECLLTALAPRSNSKRPTSKGTSSNAGSRPPNKAAPSRRKRFVSLLHSISSVPNTNHIPLPCPSRPLPWLPFHQG